MQVSVDKISDLERKMHVQVPAEEVDGQVEERLKSMAPRTKVHGFRPGKVPLRVVRQMYGKQVREEVLGELIQSSFIETVQKEALRPAGGPQVERNQDAPGEPFEYSATFEVYPDIELKPLEELEVRRVSADIEDTDVDRVVENMRRQRTRWEPVERPAQEGDRVTLSFEGRIDGEVFPGGNAKDYPLVLGSGQMIPGFEDGLVGVEAGDSPTLDLTFPDDYPNQELAGKPAQFAVEIKSVARPDLPELDDAFFASFGIDEGGREAFYDAVKQNMARELEQTTRGRVKSELFDRLVEANDVSVPRTLVEQEIDGMIEQMQQRTGVKAKSGLPRELFTEQAERRVKLSLIVGELVRASEIQPDPERVRQAIESHASGYENPEEVIKWIYSNRDQLSSVEMAVLEDQVVDWVLERAKVVDEKIPFDEMMTPPGQAAPTQESEA
ncbi:MAG: trigger factor [Gammaproteobacteria bacterium]|nr:trigger factor [Gammaproteobacteria bacterium]